MILSVYSSNPIYVNTFSSHSSDSVSANTAGSVSFIKFYIYKESSRILPDVPYDALSRLYSGCECIISRHRKRRNDRIIIKRGCALLYDLYFISGLQQPVSFHFEFFGTHAHFSSVSVLPEICLSAVRYSEPGTRNPVLNHSLTHLLTYTLSHLPTWSLTLLVTYLKRAGGGKCRSCSFKHLIMIMIIDHLLYPDRLFPYGSVLRIRSLFRFLLRIRSLFRFLLRIRSFLRFRLFQRPLHQRVP